MTVPSLGYSESLQHQFNNLDGNQIKVLQQAYHAGSKYSLGLTLSSIVWQESDFGRYPVNLQDPSCGVTHIKISTARKLLPVKIGNSPFDKNRICAYLLSNKVAFRLALSELLFWVKYHNGSLYLAISSYNGGYIGNLNYAKDIWSKIKFLKTHIVVRR